VEAPSHFTNLPPEPADPPNVRTMSLACATVYQPLFPQLNLRQWAGSIYTWLTQPVLDPTNSGRVTMDNLMKLVTTALEWSYEAKDSDVKVERLKSAAELLVLRHDTLRIIDGAGPHVEAPPSESTEEGNGSGMEAECADHVNQALSMRSAQTTSHDVAGDSARSTKATKCTFSGMVVTIELQRFQESSTRLVECPDCVAMRTLEPHGGVLRFKSHGRRKTTTPNTGQRWARGKTDWDVVNG
jgi:hypothetical protein